MGNMYHITLHSGMKSMIFVEKKQVKRFINPFVCLKLFSGKYFINIAYISNNRAGESCAFSKLHDLWPFPRSLLLSAEDSPLTSLVIHWGQDYIVLWNGS